MRRDPDRLPCRPALTTLIAALLAVAACSRPGAGDPLEQVAAIHGAAGPFAVAGYRAGARALKELGLSRTTFDLDVVHESPAEVQWSCIADGLQAATGVSAGKLNLHLREVPQAELRTIVRQKSTGRTIVFHLKPGFTRRFLDLPRADLGRAGGEVMALPDDEIFTVEESRAPPP